MTAIVSASAASAANVFHDHHAGPLTAALATSGFFSALRTACCAGGVTLALFPSRPAPGLSRRRRDYRSYYGAPFLLSRLFPSGPRRKAYPSPQQGQLFSRGGA